MSSALRLVYRKSIRISLWPLMRLTSGTDKPISKKRLIASCLRSWKWRFSIFALALIRSHDSRKAFAEIWKMRCSSLIPEIERISSRTWSAFGLNGTVRGWPFFVSRRCAVWCLKFKSRHLSERTSPLLIPVAKAKTNTPQTYGFLHRVIANSSFSNSPSSSLRVRGLFAIGFLIRVTGLIWISYPHSIRAKFSRLLSIPSSRLTVEPETDFSRSSLKPATTDGVNLLICSWAMRCRLIWRRWQCSDLADFFFGMISVWYRSRIWSKIWSSGSIRDSSRGTGLGAWGNCSCSLIQFRASFLRLKVFDRGTDWASRICTCHLRFRARRVAILPLTNCDNRCDRLTIVFTKTISNLASHWQRLF